MQGPPFRDGLKAVPVRIWCRARPSGRADPIYSLQPPDPNLRTPFSRPQTQAPASTHHDSRRQPSCPRELLKQRGGLSKPGAFPPPDVVGHRRLLAKDAPGPFTGFFRPAFGCQQARVVVLSLRERRRFGDGREERGRLLALTGSGERMGAQAGGALEVVLG